MTDNPFASLSPEQRTQAEAIQAEIMKAAEAEVQQIAALLAAKQLPEVLGQTEFQIRDHLHRIGAVSLEAALETKKKRIIQAVAAFVPEIAAVTPVSRNTDTARRSVCSAKFATPGRIIIARLAAAATFPAIFPCGWTMKAPPSPPAR